VVAVPVNDEATRTSLLCEAITERTRVVAVSHVHWVTGTMVDLQQIGRHCHAHDALLVVDGIQAMGATPVSLDGVDVYCGAVFKWLLSGFGLSIAALTQRALDRLQPAYVGYANAPPEQGLRYAHVNYPGIYALNAALEHLEGYGWPDIYARVASLVERLVAGVERLGYVVAAPVRARAGIVSIAPPEAASLRHALARDGIDVEERAGFLRCSPHFYNTEEDIDRLLAALPRASSSSV
jgi:cysteine desulfurase/selenocysteine lyase